MTARAQMEQVKLEGFKLKGTYVVIKSFIKQLTLVVKQCFFHACNKSDHMLLRTEAAIILQFLRCLGNVTSYMRANFSKLLRRPFRQFGC